MHLWDLSLNKNAWLTSEINDNRFLGDYSAIRKNYLLDDYFNDIKNFNIKKTVYVQAGWDENDALGEVKWITQTNSERKHPSAIVAYVDLSKNDVPKDLESLTNSSPLVKGIRQLTSWHENSAYRNCSEDYLNNPTWTKQLSLLEKFNLAFDLQIYAEQAERAFEIVSKNQGIPIAIEHAMQPINREKDYLLYWKKQLKKLAELPNTVIKLSGLGMFNHHWSTDNFRQLLEPIIEIFTPARCMIGSNFPVDKLYGSFDKTYHAYIEITSQYSASEQHALFYKTADDFYML